MHSMQTVLQILNFDLSQIYQNAIRHSRDTRQWQRAVALSQSCDHKGKQPILYGVVLNALLTYNAFKLSGHNPIISQITSVVNILKVQSVLDACVRTESILPIIFMSSKQTGTLLHAYCFQV